MAPYWKRVEVLVHRINVSSAVQNRGVLRAAGNLMLEIIKQNNYEDKDKLGRALCCIYDAVNDALDDEYSGILWYDLGLHLNKFRS